MPAGEKSPLEGLATLGVGLLYNAALPEFLKTSLDQVDYLEVIPDTFWTTSGEWGEGQYLEIESAVGFLDAIVSRRPVVGHNIGFSLGSAEPFEVAYLEQIADWQCRYAFPWHSDHLSFARVAGHEEHEHDAGLAVPVPYDGELLELVAERVDAIQRRIAAPFLIENNVYFIDFPEQEMTEPEFLNALTEQTDCGLLLDLHNVYTNARNHGFDALAFVEELDLSRVVEIHIAGGSEIGGVYTDSHAGPCPEPVWELLASVGPQAKNLCGVTFEFHHSYYPLLGSEGVTRELSRAREILDLRPTKLS